MSYKRKTGSTEPIRQAYSQVLKSHQKLDKKRKPIDYDPTAELPSEISQFLAR